MSTMDEKMKQYWPDLSDAELTELRGRDRRELAHFLAARFRISEHEAQAVLARMEEDLPG